MAWKFATRVGKYASPLLVDGLIYTAAEENYVTCPRIPVLEISSATANHNHGKIDVTVIISNIGDAFAEAVTIGAKRETTLDGKATHERPPVALGNIAPSGTAATILTFSGVKTGIQTLQLGMTYSGGTSVLSIPVPVP